MTNPSKPKETGTIKAKNVNILKSLHWSFQQVDKKFVITTLQ